ncbi:MAG TPA: TetR/AcrR family transcriptional regulator [Chloroflexia bacterium]|nr:TetR/AcrR family transcriptional regulator [Chloroflexia bacterium]
MASTSIDTPRSAGRPRSPEADRAILATTLRLLVEQGYDAMSIESVAAAAGVGKTTIYRRYPNKRELVVAAVLSIADTIELPPDSGSVRADLLDVMHQAFAIFHNGIAFSMMGTLLVKERDDPELLDLFRRKVILPRMEIMGRVFRRAIDRGEVKADISVPLAVQMLSGSMFARHISGYPEDEEWLESVIDTLLLGTMVRPE